MSKKNVEKLPYIDSSQLTASHINSVNFIRKILQKYDESIDSISEEKLFYILRNFKTKKDRNLSIGSCNSIISIISKYNESIKFSKTIKINKEKLKVEKNRKNEDKLNSEIENIVKDCILYFINLFVNFLNNFNCEIIYDTSYNTSFAVLLTIITNLRISELQQLYYSDLIKIINCKEINIRTKKSKKSVHLIANIEMLKRIIVMLPSVYKDKNKLINCSSTSINKLFRNKIKLLTNYNPKYDELKSLRIMNNKQIFRYNKNKFGLQIIRKINTTTLIEFGSLKLAQEFNRHLTSDVTDQYYNTKTYILPHINKIFSNI